jgi:hypothetical protein
VYAGLSDFAFPLLRLVTAHLCPLWQPVISAYLIDKRIIRFLVELPSGTLIAFTFPVITKGVLINAAVLVIQASVKGMIDLVDFFLCLRVVLEQRASVLIASVLSRPYRKCFLPLRFND